MIQPSIDEFVAAARKFCSFAEDESDVVPADIWKIRDLLLRLITHVTAIENAPQGTDFGAAGPDDATFQKVAHRFGDFPFNLYRFVFDPHDLNAIDEPVMGMLSNDLADIYREISIGLDNAERGHLADAYFDWSFGYRSHWARHAMSALMAIELWRTDNYQTIGPR